MGRIYSLQSQRIGLLFVLTQKLTTSLIYIDWVYGLTFGGFLCLIHRFRRIGVAFVKYKGRERTLTEFSNKWFDIFMSVPMLMCVCV